MAPPSCQVVITAISLSLFIALAGSFDTNCTYPTHSEHFVSSPNTRGTLDILWTCLGTIIACTYTVLHPRVPDLRSSTSWTRLGTTITLAVITTLAPEVTLTVAVSIIWFARQELRELHRDVPKTRKAWKMTHMIFANMNGFSMRHHVPVAPADAGGTSLLGKAAFIDFKVSASHLVEALRQGWEPDELPTDDQIMDRSKTDLFAKLLAIGQTSYFLLAVLARLGRGLPVSQLEVGVSGFVVCAVFTYLLHIKPPKAVAGGIVLGAYNTNDARSRPFATDFETFEKNEQFFGEVLESLTCFTSRTHAIWMYTFFATATTFGAVHLAAWNLEFPTVIDTWLWRGASVTYMAATPMFLVIGVVGATNEKLGVPTMLMMTLLYIAARAILIVEMFRTLLYLPPEAFLTTWTRNIPHLG